MQRCWGVSVPSVCLNSQSHQITDCKDTVADSFVSLRPFNMLHDVFSSLWTNSISNASHMSSMNFIHNILSFEVVASAVWLLLWQTSTKRSCFHSLHSHACRCQYNDLNMGNAAIKFEREWHDLASFQFEYFQTLIGACRTRPPGDADFSRRSYRSPKQIRWMFEDDKVWEKYRVMLEWRIRY